ncbi:hypothetical protein [Nitrosomonas ureae]|uniref:Uncharacterized protein n=1 Tax=Nitrosomonas ureae TaxID=44577 RepID=A0A286A778_9PROT|nr:hypothetical protein [Nitrosomonas ureae]SOD17746.1 hypothetical protein SAMN06297164_1328 [Nitrosomonas ureae]
MQNERQDFNNAIIGLVFAKSDGNKEAQNKIKESFMNNYLLKRVNHLEKYGSKFKIWGMERKRHAQDRKAKKLVREWREVDKKKGSTKVNMIPEYQQRLYDLKHYPIGKNKSKSEKRYPDEDKKYADSTITTWLIKL